MSYPGGGAIGNFFDRVEMEGPVNANGDCAMSLSQHVAGIDYTVGFSYQKVDMGAVGSKMWHALRREELQIMMDALWGKGVRPTSITTKEMFGGEGFNAGKVEAMQEHLADMRRLVFGQPPVEEPRGPDIPLTRDIIE